MNFIEILKHIARGQFTEKALDKASQEIGNRQPQLKNVSQHNVLGHAYATNLLGAPSFTSEGPGYDEKTADELRELYPLTIPKPEQYEGDVISSDSFDAWIWHQELGEYVKHSGSIDPRTGLVLKGRGHRTWKEMVEGEKELGNEVILKNGRYYSRPMLGLGRGLLDFKERNWDKYENQQDLDNNKVAEQFFKDLPDMSFDDQMMAAKRSIFQREYMRNPQYNWQLYRNY